VRDIEYLTTPMQPYSAWVQISACLFAVPETSLPLLHLGAVCSVDHGWSIRLPPSPPGHEETPGWFRFGKVEGHCFNVQRCVITFWSHWM